ncbi:hypothetical protein RJ640_007915 [Escallonia rubra]|uniref:SET domain-containing protein n=1 Tax=Escallonia rubra TaxID=112253 RepID=A0AA88UMJ1_9ASTE|nr:hypothetical protein RJ640_007915 [Escallonia rubra]
MAALLHLHPPLSSPPPPPSSSFLSPATTLTHLCSSRTKSTHHFKTPAIKSEPLPPAVETFWKWLSDEKVVSNKSPAKPGLVQEGLGLVAQRDIGRNEVVLEVPKRFWINPDTVSASDIGSLCGGLKPWVSVALFLIREMMRDDSPWRFYLDVLPECTDSTIYWSEEELLEIQVSMISVPDGCLSSLTLMLTTGILARTSNRVPAVETVWYGGVVYDGLTGLPKILHFPAMKFDPNHTFAGTQLLSTTTGVKEYVKSEFLKVEKEIILPNEELFPFPVTSDDFLWAFGMLRSRAFSRLRGQNLVLIPLADLINHSPSITTEDYAWEIKGAGLFSRDLIFSLRSPIPVKAGEQVLIQYDLNKSNGELALDYGFIESRSDRKGYTLTLDISESDANFGDKLDIAESNGMGGTAYFDIVLGRPLPSVMLPYLRLVALGGTDAFLLESIFRNSIWGHLELPVSRANEELICQVVRNACKSALSGYRTTIEEDVELMKGGNLDPRLEIAVGIRAGEKEVLQYIDGIFEERESELDEYEYYQERRLRDLGLVGEQGEIIFWEPK